jgi:hypothetical protein
MERCQIHKTYFSLSCSRCNAENELLMFGNEFIEGSGIVKGQTDIFNFLEDPEEIEEQ